VSAYFVFNYDVIDADGFSQYPPAAQPSLRAHGAKVLVADFHSEAEEGQPHQVTIVLEFDSREAAQAWYRSPEYQSVIRLRTDNTEGMAVLCDGYEVPR
jgi:uncharacterized protein (DUF1330 family)